MKTRALALACLVLLGGTTGGDDPLTRPITGADATRWLEPQEPARVFGNTSYLGPRRIKHALIDTGAGLVLIDAGLPEGLGMLKEQLARLGYRLADVRWLLVSEPHYDHAGAIAAVVRESGAQVMASASAAMALRRGISGHEDPQRASLLVCPPVSRVLVLRDGQRLKLGNATIIARAMPGHTPGSMGWSWRSCEGDDCARIFFAASVNPLTAGSYRYSAHPRLIAVMRRTLDRLAREPCDILLSNHAEHSGADERLAALLAGQRPNPMREPQACAAMATRYRALLEEQLRREAGATSQ